MSSIINSVKSDVIKNGKANWPGIFFSAAEPMAFIGIFIALKHAFESLENPKVFDISNLHMAFFLALGFTMRIAYMWSKPLARVLILCNAVGWIAVTVVYFMAYKKI